MPRPRHEHPTPAELEILNVLWSHGPMTVRQVMEKLEDRAGPPTGGASSAAAQGRAYTTIMSHMNVMFEKGLLERRPEGRAFIYEPSAARETTLRGMIGDLLNRAFAGSASLLVSQLLDQAAPTSDELAEIRKAIKSYERERQGD